MVKVNHVPISQLLACI